MNLWMIVSCICDSASFSSLMNFYNLDHPCRIYHQHHYLLLDIYICYADYFPRSITFFKDCNYFTFLKCKCYFLLMSFMILIFLFTQMISFNYDCCNRYFYFRWNISDQLIFYWIFFILNHHSLSISCSCILNFQMIKRYEL